MGSKLIGSCYVIIFCKSLMFLSLSLAHLPIIQSMLLSSQLQINFFVTLKLSGSLTFTTSKDAVTMLHPYLCFLPGLFPRVGWAVSREGAVSVGKSQ